jgi:hypothetical protein
LLIERTADNLDPARRQQPPGRVEAVEVVAQLALDQPPALADRGARLLRSRILPARGGGRTGIPGEGQRVREERRISSSHRLRDREKERRVLRPVLGEIEPRQIDERLGRSPAREKTGATLQARAKALPGGLGLAARGKGSAVGRARAPPIVRGREARLRLLEHAARAHVARRDGDRHPREMRRPLEVAIIERSRSERDPRGLEPGIETDRGAMMPVGLLGAAQAPQRDGEILLDEGAGLSLVKILRWSAAFRGDRREREGACEEEKRESRDRREDSPPRAETHQDGRRITRLLWVRRAEGWEPRSSGPAPSTSPADSAWFDGGP